MKSRTSGSEFLKYCKQGTKEGELFFTSGNHELVVRGFETTKYLDSQFFSTIILLFPLGFWWFSGKKDPWKEWKWKLPLENKPCCGRRYMRNHQSKPNSERLTMGGGMAAKTSQEVFRSEGQTTTSRPISQLLATNRGTGEGFRCSAGVDSSKERRRFSHRGGCFKGPPRGKQRVTGDMTNIVAYVCTSGVHKEYLFRIWFTVEWGKSWRVRKHVS